MVSYHILVSNLAEGSNLSVHRMLLEVLVEAQMNLDLLHSVLPLVQAVLNLVDFAKASFTDDLKLLEQPVVSILFKIFAKFVLISLFLAPENEFLLTFEVLHRSILLDRNVADQWLHLLSLAALQTSRGNDAGPLIPSLDDRFGSGYFPGDGACPFLIT